MAKRTLSPDPAICKDRKGEVMETEVLKCSRCGGETDHLDDGDVCCSCWSEENEFECCLCGEYEHVDHQHKLLVIFEECGRTMPGIYKIIASPYWCSNYFDMWFFSDALERIADAPISPEWYGYPSGHLCQKCQVGANAANPQPAP